MSEETNQPTTIAQRFEEVGIEISRSDVILADVYLRNEGEDAIRDALIYCNDLYEDEEYGPHWGNLRRLAILGASSILRFHEVSR